MKKWLGKTPSGYGDPSLMTVSGAGRVKTANGSMRPKTAAAFTGTLEIEDPAISFTISADEEEPVADAIAVPSGTLATAAALTVDLNFTGRPPAGNYTLASAGSWTGGDTISIGTLSGELSAARAAKLDLVRSGNTLILKVPDAGLVLSVK